MNNNIKIVGVAPGDWSTAARIGQGFMHDYPDRPEGVRYGFGYRTAQGLVLYVYRVKTGVVVRGNGNA